MKVDLLTLIKSCKMFSSLDEEALRELLKKSNKVNLLKNKFVFRQGDLTTSTYLVVSGRVAIILKRADKKTRTLREMGPGETFGEVSSITHEPRSVAAKAIEKSILLEIPSDIFCHLSQQYPSILSEAISVMIDRSKKLIEMLASDHMPKKHIVIVPAIENISSQKLLEKLQPLIKQMQDVTLLSDEDEEFNKTYSTQIGLEQYIVDLEKKNETILYSLSLKKSTLAENAFQKADMIYVIAEANSTATISPLVKKLIQNKYASHKIKPELVLLYEDENKSPTSASSWTKLANFGLHHNIRINLQKDCERILRFMLSKAVGLVLGGGGVRGWAHLGVIKALLEANIPIDFIGGSSGGAIVAGYYALHETYQDTHNDLREFSEVTSKTISLSNVTWPAVSIFDGIKYTRELMHMFRKAKIENLWIPFFCTSSNLAKNTQVIRRGGYLWKAVRASTAVPAVFPPVVINGELHMDGGILNNLPVDSMKRLTSGVGTIIAVQLIHSVKESGKYNFPMMLPFWKTILAKLGFAHKEYKFPPFIDTFLRALLAGSSAKQTENSMLADMLINPDLSQFHLLSLKKNEDKELINIGYHSALDVIQKWKKDKATPAANIVPKKKKVSIVK